jgi:nucleotide-binding universal stress UspA family protein
MPDSDIIALRPVPRTRTVEHCAAGQGIVAVSAIRRIDRIFHPSDFSEGSDVAFAHALKLALVAEAELDVLHVSEGEDVGWTEFPRVRGMLERWHVLPPNSPREAVPAIGIEVRKVVMKGPDPVRAAERFLKENPTDLVVLAAHTHQGRMHWARNSISQPIAEAAASAALFLPYGSEGFVAREDGSTSLRNVLLPIDLAPKPEPALEAARRLTWALQCPEVTFTLLHVGGEGEAPAVPLEEHDDWTWQKVTREGDVVDTILAVADETAADLIVMATAGRHGFLDALRGSTTERVLRSGVRPLLAIPAGAQAV